MQDHDCKLASKTFAAYQRIIGPVREAARACGYAIAVHGSLSRDIDLVAIPWVSEAVAPAVLADAVAKAAQGFVAPHEADRFPEHKGVRLCWAFHLGGGPYIDLSVIPPESPS